MCEAAPSTSPQPEEYSNRYQENAQANARIGELLEHEQARSARLQSRLDKLDSITSTPLLPLYSSDPLFTILVNHGSCYCPVSLSLLIMKFVSEEVPPGLSNTTY